MRLFRASSQATLWTRQDARRMWQTWNAWAMAEGYIYILLNRAFQNDHYKIGMTTKAPEERARQLSSATGIPRDFEVLYEQRVIDCKQAEWLLHRRLSQYRSTGKEFFQIPLKAAIKALEMSPTKLAGSMSWRACHRLRSPTMMRYPRAGEISVMSSRPRRKTSTKKATPTIVTFDDHASYTDAVRQPILYDLRNRVFGLDGSLRQTEQCTPGQRIAYNVPSFKIFWK